MCGCVLCSFPEEEEEVGMGDRRGNRSWYLGLFPTIAILFPPVTDLGHMNITRACSWLVELPCGENTSEF